MAIGLFHLISGGRSRAGPCKRPDPKLAEGRYGIPVSRCFTIGIMIYPMRLRACLTALWCLVTLARAGAVVAQESPDSAKRNPHAVQPERPTVATHAGTVARGWIELEEGVEWDKNPDGSRSFIAPTHLKIGLSPRSQINLLFNLIPAPASITSDLAIGDFAVGIKYRLLD